MLNNLRNKIEKPVGGIDKPDAGFDADINDLYARLAGVEHQADAASEERLAVGPGDDKRRAVDAGLTEAQIVESWHGDAVLLGWTVLRLMHGRRFDGPSFRQMDSATFGRQSSGTQSVLGVSLCVWYRTGSYRTNFAQWHVNKLLRKGLRCCKATPNQARHGRYQAAHDLVHDVAAMPQSEKQGIQILRRSGCAGLRAVERLCCVLGGYGVDLPRWVEHRACRQRRRLRSGKLRLGSEVRASKEQAKVFGMDIS